MQKRYRYKKKSKIKIQKIKQTGKQKKKGIKNQQQQHYKQNITNII